LYKNCTNCSLAQSDSYYNLYVDCFSPGTVSVKTSVLKDNHTFTVHILDPKDNTADDNDVELQMDSERSGAEKAEFEKPEKENKEGKNILLGSIKKALHTCISLSYM